MKKNVLLALATALVISLTVSGQNRIAQLKKDTSSHPIGRGEMPRQAFGNRQNFGQAPFRQRGAQGLNPRQAEKPQLTAKKRAGYMAVNLDLSDAQRDKLQALFEKQDKARAERQAEIKKLREQEIVKAEAERKTQETELEKILGPEKFKQFQAEQKTPRLGERGGMRGPANAGVPQRGPQSFGPQRGGQGRPSAPSTDQPNRPQGGPQGFQN